MKKNKIDKSYVVLVFSSSGSQENKKKVKIYPMR